MTSTIKPIPCPFCGGKKFYVSCLNPTRVRCEIKGCYAVGPTRNSEKAAIRAWNRRKEPTR